MEEKTDLNPLQLLKKEYTREGVYLSESTIQYLISNQLKINPNVKHHSFPQSPSELMEGIHYYIDSGKWVFTEYYHFLRGHCCRNGCRHCVYGRKLDVNT